MECSFGWETLSCFQISLTIQTTGFNETLVVGQVGGQDETITGDQFILHNFDNVTAFQILPFLGLEPSAFEHLSGSFIFLLVLSVPHELLIGILDEHGYDDETQGQQCGGLSTSDRYAGDHLQYADQQEIH